MYLSASGVSYLGRYIKCSTFTFFEQVKRADRRCDKKLHPYDRFPRVRVGSTPRIHHLATLAHHANHGRSYCDSSHVQTAEKID